MDRTSHLFQYNETFGDAPSEMTDLAWAELFPSQGGLFKNPELAPERSALSVFHQLHCLVSVPSDQIHSPFTMLDICVLTFEARMVYAKVTGLYVKLRRKASKWMRAACQ